MKKTPLEILNIKLLRVVTGAALALISSFGPSNAAVINWDNSPASGSISSFGAPDTKTYGQVFTAPLTGTLTSFTLWLNGGVGSLFGGVGDWNGTATYGLGFGSPNNLYQSANVASVGAAAFTFSPNVGVVAGQRYVAYLSVFGIAQPNATTTMPLSVNSISGVDYFVWNNTSDPRNNPSWNYFANFGDVRFAASFEAPEPSTLALIGIALLSLFGFGMMRRHADA